MGFSPRSVVERLPLALFCLSLAVLLLGMGMAIERYNLFPRSIFSNASKTALETLDALGEGDTADYRGFSDTPLSALPARRSESAGGGAFSAPLLLSGGRHQYRELCPEHGCLAIAVAPSGAITHAWPFRPLAIQAANVTSAVDYPFELNFFSRERDTHFRSFAQYPNGDLLVTFSLRHAFPYAGGVARIDSDGHPRWFRWDYSHHVPSLTEGDVAFVPSLTVSHGVYSWTTGGDAVSYRCDGKYYRSAIDVIDGDGVLLEQIPVFGILQASGHAIASLSDPCDPLHLNSVTLIGESADGSHGILPGDIVLSFRNIHTFAILDGKTHDLKHLIRGTFRRQHDVTHLTGSTFLMFDNLGGRGEDGDRFSRLLAIDIGTGVETVIFPNARTPDHLRGLLSGTGGSVDISPDRTRAIVPFSEEGVVVEVRLSDGGVVGVWRSLHDVSGLGHFPEERLDRAAIFPTWEAQYVGGGAQAP